MSSGFLQRQTVLDLLKCFPFLFSFSLARVSLTAICLGVGGVLLGAFMSPIIRYLAQHVRDVGLVVVVVDDDVFRGFLEPHGLLVS